MSATARETLLHNGKYATCIACTHFEMRGGGGGCDTCGYGGEPEAKCGKGHWNVDPTWEKEFAAEIHRAQECADFRGRGL